MSTTIIIPGPLRNFTNQQRSVNVQSTTLSGVLGQLVSDFPALKDHIFDEQGKIRRFVNIFLNEEDIRFLDDHNAPLRGNDVVELVPAISGG